ncbi:MAG: hypothetical protein KBD27_00390 [Candidatus Moranbacteria bacterium]|nr:hypothetical protein [Candidatus Moranbacteria bacterium]
MALDQAQLRDELIKAFHLEQIPEDKRDELLEKMGEALLKRVFLATMEKIGDDGVAEYEILLEKQATPEEVEAFFETKIPGYDVFVRDVATEFKEEMTKSL